MGNGCAGRGLCAERSTYLLAMLMRASTVRQTSRRLWQVDRHKVGNKKPVTRDPGSIVPSRCMVQTTGGVSLYVHVYMGLHLSLPWPRQWLLCRTYLEGPQTKYTMLS